MQIPPPQDNWLDNLAFTCLAAFAGLLGHLMRSMNERRAITWPRSLIETLASGLIGYLTVLLCRAAGISAEWTGFMAGVLGWLGAATSMMLFERQVRKKLGLDDVNSPTAITTGAESAPLVGTSPTPVKPDSGS